MRGAPQFGLSAFIRRINWRSSPLTFGPVDETGTESPKQPEPGPMPANHRLRLDHDQGLGPARPQMAERNPEWLIEVMQLGTRLLPLEDGELLTKSNGFQSEFMARKEERAQVGDHCESKRDHQSDRS